MKPIAPTPPAAPVIPAPQVPALTALRAGAIYKDSTGRSSAVLAVLKDDNRAAGSPGITYGP